MLFANKNKKIQTFCILILCGFFGVTSVAWASTPKAVAEELASDIASQRQNVEDWVPIHPNLASASSWSFWNRLRVNILVSEDERRLYSQTYQIAVELYDLSRESLDTAENSFQRGDYPDAKKYLVLSINRLLYAGIMYDAAHQVWNDEITTAQQTLYSICKTSGKVAGASFGGALGNPAISVAMELEIAAVCNDAFDKGAKQTFWDTISTLAWTTIREVIGIVSKPVAVTIGIIKELPLVEKAFAPVPPPNQPADIIYDFVKREDLLTSLFQNGAKQEKTQPSDLQGQITNTTSPAQTLTVILSANRYSGTAPLNGVILTATVSGSAKGTINYTFYCNRSDSEANITSGWVAKFDGIFDNPKTATCDYPNSGTYTAKVITERGSAPPVEARVSINVVAPTPATNQQTPSTPAPVVQPPPSTPAQTLFVNLSANKDNGVAPLNGVSLTAMVSGSAQGTINYTFYCNRSDSGTNITSGWDAKSDGIFDNPKVATCNYSNPGAYTAKVIAERGSAPPAEARASINVISVSVVNPMLSLWPTSGPKGTKFTFSGTGFTPNGSIKEIITKPDGIQYSPLYHTANSDGRYAKTYDSNTASIFGTYTIYWVDESTDKNSSSVSETIYK